MNVETLPRKPWIIKDPVSYVMNNPDVDLKFLKSKRRFNNTNAFRLMKESEGYITAQLEGRRYAEFYTTSLESLEYLPEVTVYRHFHLKFCPNLRDFDNVKFEVHEDSTPADVRDAWDRTLNYVHEIIVRTCPSLDRTPDNMVARRIEIDNCESLRKIGTAYARLLDISDNPELREICDKSNAEVVIIKGCPKLESIPDDVWGAISLLLENGLSHLIQPALDAGLWEIDDFVHGCDAQWYKRKDTDG